MPSERCARSTIWQTIQSLGSDREGEKAACNGLACSSPVQIDAFSHQRKAIRFADAAVDDGSVSRESVRLLSSK